MEMPGSSVWRTVSRIRSRDSWGSENSGRDRITITKWQTPREHRPRAQTCMEKPSVTGCDLPHKFTTRHMLSLKPESHTGNSYYAAKFQMAYYANRLWSLFVEIKDISKKTLVLRLLRCTVSCLCILESYWFGKNCMDRMQDQFITNTTPSAGLGLKPKLRRTNSRWEGYFRIQSSAYFRNRFLNYNAFRSSSWRTYLQQLYKAPRLDGSSQILLYWRNSHW